MKIKKMSQKITYWLGVVAVGLIFGASLQVAQGWVNPPASPPGANVGAPITTGAHQTKSGGLTLNSAGTSTYALYANGLTYVNGMVQATAAFYSSGAASGFATYDRTGAAGHGVFYRVSGINRFYDSSAGDVIAYNSSGNVGIGTISPGSSLKLDVNGNVGASAFYYSSDERLKNEIRPISGALDKILELEGVNFKWEATGQESIGFIAQKLEKVFPELVMTDDEGFKYIKYGELSAPLAEAIKEQQEEIKALKEEIKILKEEINALK